MNLNVKARLVAAICQFKAERDIRYYLNGVYVEPIETGGVLIVATNGHAMGIWRDLSGKIERPAILRIGKKLEAACAGSDLKRLRIIDDRLAVVIDPAKDSKGTQAALSEVYVQNKHSDKPGSWEVEGKFPNWKRVIPSQASGLMLHDALHPDYVALAEKAIRLGNGTKFIGISFIQPNKNDGIAVIANGTADFFGIIMPLREVSTQYPEWVNTLKAATTEEVPLPEQQPSDAAPQEGGAA